eukprot:350733-Chlamydomonas_euryale.AAC.1
MPLRQPIGAEAERGVPSSGVVGLGERTMDPHAITREQGHQSKGGTSQTAETSQKVYPARCGTGLVKNGPCLGRRRMRPKQTDISTPQHTPFSSPWIPTRSPALLALHP